MFTVYNYKVPDTNNSGLCKMSAFTELKQRKTNKQMPYFSEGSTYLSEGAKHDFCSQRGQDNTCACKSQRKLSWKVIHENGFCQAPFSLSVLHQSW